MRRKKIIEDDATKEKTYYYILPLLYKFPLNINGVELKANDKAVGILLVYDNEEELRRHHPEAQRAIKIEVDM